MRIAPNINVTDEDRKTLERWSRGRSTPARLVLRSQIVLRTADGLSNKVVAEKLGVDRLLVGKWRRRFAEKGLAGIEKDAPRGGRPAVSREGVTARIIEWTTQRKPRNATHWSCRTLAKELGNVAEGKLIGTCMPRHRHQEWIKFLKQIEEQTPADLDLHLIADNYCTHKHPKVQNWLKRHPRFHMHFIPTSSSWLNLVERWFREITDKRIRRGVFHSVPRLIDAIMSYIDTHNENPESFEWTAKSEDIIEKVRRAREVLDKSASA